MDRDGNAMGCIELHLTARGHRANQIILLSDVDLMIAASVPLKWPELAGSRLPFSRRAQDRESLPRSIPRACFTCAGRPRRDRQFRVAISERFDQIEEHPEDAARADVSASQR